MDHTTHSSPAILETASLERAGEFTMPERVIAPRATRLSCIVLSLIALVYIGVCFAPVIFDDNEGLYAGAVREMHASGNWLIPTVNGFPRVQKPPLVYWTMLVSTSIFGQNEFALRLPNALATVGWIFATYLITRRLGGERFGLASAAMLATMIGVWIFNHLVQPEPFLACFISLAIWCLVEARFQARPELEQPRFFADRFPGDGWYLAFWTFLALGSMSKGIHGALWPLGTVLLAAIFVPGLRPWLKPVLSLRGAAVFLLIFAPWYIYMAAKLPGFLAAHFINEQVGAALDTRYPADARQLSLVQFYGQHLIFWMPWALLFPAALLLAFKARRATNLGRPVLSAAQVDLARMLLCWFALTQISVAFSTRQDYYSMSCWGIVAAFLALPWTLAERSPLSLPRWLVSAPCIILQYAGAAAIGLTLGVVPNLGKLGEATASPIRDRDTFLDAIEGISPGLWGNFIALLAIFGLAVLAGATAALILYRRGRSYPALLTLSAAMGVPILLATCGFTMMSSFFSLAPEAAAINREIAAEPDAIVACDAAPNTASSLYAYLNARVHWVDTRFDQQYPQAVLHLGHDYFWDDARLVAEWRSPHPVYLILEQTRLDYWKQQLPPGARLVNASGTRLVLCNR